MRHPGRRALAVLALVLALLVSATVAERLLREEPPPESSGDTTAAARTQPSPAPGSGASSPDPSSSLTASAAPDPSPTSHGEPPSGAGTDRGGVARGSPAGTGGKAPEDQVASGRVVDALTGRPIAGAKVRILLEMRDPNPREVVTDREGRFRLEDLPRERQRSLEVQAPGYVERRSLVGTGVMEQDDITIALSPSSKVFGRVLDLEGRPVPGARIYVDGIYGLSTLEARPDMFAEAFRRIRQTGRTFETLFTAIERAGSAATTDHAGRFEVADIPVAQSLTLLASAAGFSPSEPRRGVVVPPGSPGEEVDLVLRPDTTLVLRIVVARGMDPPAEIAATAMVPIAPRPFRQEEDGSWTVNGLAGGRTWYLVEAPPFAAVFDSVEVAPGKRTEAEVRLGDDEGLAGHVMDAGGRGVAGLRIVARPAFEGAPRVDLAAGAVTDESGRFSVPGLRN